MHKEEIKGKAREIGGRIEEKYGELTGNEQAAADGRVMQLQGQAEQLVGRAKAKAHELID